LLEQSDVAAAMFHIEDHELEAGGVEDWTKTRREELERELAEDGFSFAQALANGLHRDS
jgi:hypothetical protein